MIAGRAHGFNRTLVNITNVVHCNQATLKKRLLEFKNTPSSMLNLTEFMTVDLEEAQDPPSYKGAYTKGNECIDNFFKTYNNNKMIYEVKTWIEKHQNKKINIQYVNFRC